MLVAKSLFVGLFFTLFQVKALREPFVKIKKTQWLQNISLGLINIFIVLFLQKAIEHWQGPAKEISSSDLLPLRILAFILLFDALSYFWHRASHKFWWLWLWHKLHHQEPAIETTSAFRFHPIEVTLSLLPRLTLATLLSATSNEVIIFEIVFQLSNMFQHSNFAIPKKLDQYLAKIIITPSQHRLHHSQNEAQQNKNFSTIFNVWDKIFASQELNFEEQIKTMGLKK